MAPLPVGVQVGGGTEGEQVQMKCCDWLHHGDRRGPEQTLGWETEKEVNLLIWHILNDERTPHCQLLTSWDYLHTAPLATADHCLSLSTVHQTTVDTATTVMEHASNPPLHKQHQTDLYRDGAMHSHASTSAFGSNLTYSHKTMIMRRCAEVRSNSMEHLSNSQPQTGFQHRFEERVSTLS